MNERIRELATQADLFQILSNGNLYPTTMTAEQSIAAYQKFAKLIVQECVGILMKPDYVMTHTETLSEYNTGWVNGRLLGIDHIKEHFGVES